MKKTVSWMLLALALALAGTTANAVEKGHAKAAENSVTGIDVNTLLDAGDSDAATFYFLGVYHANLVHTVLNDKACMAPGGTSNNTIAMMIRDQLKARKKDIGDSDAVFAIMKASCSLWGPPDKGLTK